MGVLVGAPLAQATASCFISPEAGVRELLIGPTNPVGADEAWQSAQREGWRRLNVEIEPWKLPG
jgi:hypothetical protein